MVWSGDLVEAVVGDVGDLNPRLGRRRGGLNHRTGYRREAHEHSDGVRRLGDERLLTLIASDRQLNSQRRENLALPVEIGEHVVCDQDLQCAALSPRAVTSPSATSSSRASARRSSAIPAGSGTPSLCPRSACSASS